MFKVPRRLSLFLATALSSVSAYALQTIEARDGVAVEAVVSIKEATRIRIDGAPIINLVGNLEYGATCGDAAAAAPGIAGQVPSAPGSSPTPRNPLAEVAVECDKDRGEVYVRPLGKSEKPINLFISSAHATYTLVLRRDKIPADTIVIRDKTPRQLQSNAPANLKTSAAASGRSGLAPAVRAGVHVRTLKAMLVAMASDRIPPDVRVEEVGQPIQLWQEAQFSLMRVYTGRGLVGEQYQLTNISQAPMVLAEQEFDREGDDVLAVSIKAHNLRPGDSTPVYVIRRGDE